jgi:hypothetical protein
VTVEWTWALCLLSMITGMVIGGLLVYNEHYKRGWTPQDKEV